MAGGRSSTDREALSERNSGSRSSTYVLNQSVVRPALLDRPLDEEWLEKSTRRLSIEERIDHAEYA